MRLLYQKRLNRHPVNFTFLDLYIVWVGSRLKMGKYVASDTNQFLFNGNKGPRDKFFMCNCLIHLEFIISKITKSFFFKKTHLLSIHLSKVSFKDIFLFIPK